MRGFLWENLEAEIEKMFEDLDGKPSEERMRCGVSRDLYHKCYFGREDEVVTKLEQDHLHQTRARLNDIRHKRVKPSGICTKGYCRRPKTATTKFCQYHREMATASWHRRKTAMYEKNERPGYTQHFTIVARKYDADNEIIDTVEHDGYITTGEREDGSLYNVFVRMGKAGSSDALLDSWAKAFSKAVKAGMNINELCDSFIYERFEPCGTVKGVKGIKMCSSPTDLICKWIKKKYSKAESTDISIENDIQEMENGK